MGGPAGLEPDDGGNDLHECAECGKLCYELIYGDCRMCYQKMEGDEMRDREKDMRKEM